MEPEQGTHSGYSCVLAAQDIEYKGDSPYTGCKPKDHINVER